MGILPNNIIIGVEYCNSEHKPVGKWENSHLRRKLDAELREVFSWLFEIVPEDGEVLFEVADDGRDVAGLVAHRLHILPRQL